MISKKLSIVHCQLSIILAFLPLSVAYAQQDSTLNRTVVVENEYNPNIMDASKINVLPFFITADPSTVGRALIVEPDRNSVV